MTNPILSGQLAKDIAKYGTSVCRLIPVPGQTIFNMEYIDPTTCKYKLVKLSRKLNNGKL